MKKNEYVSPKMETVKLPEITLLQVSGGDIDESSKNQGGPWG